MRFFVITEKKLCSVNSTRSSSSLVAAAETRLQNSNQLSAEIMVTTSPEKMKTSQYAFYNAEQHHRKELTNSIQCNLSTSSEEETRNHTTRSPTRPHHIFDKQKQAIQQQTIGEQKNANR